MASANIEMVGPGEYELIRDLYNQIFKPHRDVAFFQRRLGPHRRPVMMIAELDRRPAGFSCGYELRPTTFYTWLIGVVPDARRLGVASQLMEAQQAWARDHGYEMMRFECYNQHRPVIITAIRNGFDIIGIRWDSSTGSNHVIFERQLS